jgi:hypothetical protein
VKLIKTGDAPEEYYLSQQVKAQFNKAWSLFLAKMMDL